MTESDEVSLKKRDIKQHYQREEVQQIIRKSADYKGFHKAGKCDDKGLYRYKKKDRRLLDFCEGRDYQYIARKVDRIILSTLNVFDTDVFNDWQPKDSDISPGGFAETEYLMLSVDIDLTTGHDVRDKKSLAALRTAAKFIYDELSEHTDGNILVLFSGNGVYLHLHPQFAYPGVGFTGKEKEDLFQVLSKSFNLYIQKLEKDLYKQHPDVHGLVKCDAINNRKRFFKSVLSLHRTLPYVVYPINPDDSFQIPLKTIPLSDEDLTVAATMIDDFMNAEITKKPIVQLGEVIKPYSEQIKISKKAYEEIDVNIPDEAIPIDIIKAEPVTAAIMSPDSWNKGNARRVAYMASFLTLCGWDKDAVHSYINGVAADWDVGAMDHVIDSWIQMHPPTIETIYSPGDGYPSMMMGDCKAYLPDKPDYPTGNPLRQVFMIAQRDGMAVEDPYQSDYDKLIENNGADEAIQEPDIDIDLEYPTEHLKGFDDLVSATDLIGSHYKPIFKVLWYQCHSAMIPTADIRTGKAKVDGRINGLYPIKSGSGKGEIKRVIKSFSRLVNIDCAEPTSMHSEQLIGRVVKKPKTDIYEERRGYMADDWIILDETFTLMSSTDPHYTESRRYMRMGFDKYPDNTVHKRMTDIGNIKVLEYEPTCIATFFLQPKNFDNDLLVEEGDIRRFIIPYVKMTGISKTDAYTQRIYDEKDNDQALKNFAEHLHNLKPFDHFRLTNEARERFNELFQDLIQYGLNYNEKIRNLVDMIDFTIMNYLLKFCAVQAFQHGRNMIQPADVELAYLDLFEVMHHTYQYVNNKIPGFLNYGEGWQGAEGNDQEVLRWMADQDAIDESSAIDSADYVSTIMQIFSVKERRARDILKVHKSRGWIQGERQHQKSVVWLSSEIAKVNCSKCKLQFAIASMESDSYNKKKIQYYLLIESYYNILDFAENDSNYPIANCKLQLTNNEKNITSGSEPDSGPEPAMQHHSTSTATHTELTTPTTSANKMPGPATTTTTPTEVAKNESIRLYEPQVNQRKDGEKRQDWIIRTAYETLKYNQTSGISVQDFLKDMHEPAGTDEYEDLLGVMYDLQRKGYIHQDKRSRLVRPSDKLLNLSKDAGGVAI